MPRRLRLRVEGLVQGVGFRPAVHRLAGELELAGWVRNTGAGVLIELQGDPGRLGAFLQRLRRQPPPHSRLDRFESEWLEAESGACGFTIQPAAAAGPLAAGAAPTALILPDLAPCPACLAEIRDPAGRRHGYAFTSCVHCGPRYSVLRALPFEREHTALAPFPLCPTCRTEYGNPSDRRFHAQTIACPACGPRLSWWDAAGRVVPADAIQAAAAALKAGRIVALKGLGGFQLLVRAGSAAAVGELRRRKGRPEKPLAVMAPDLAWVQRHCRLSPMEEELLAGPAAPIVLLRRRTPVEGRHPAGPNPSAIAAEVAPANPWLGVMLPSTPLHALLLDALAEPLVATSGNRSGEPLCRDEREALARLGGIADGFLVHDRAIVNPVDDSVAQVVCGEPMLLRHARGFAPTAVDLTGLLPGPEPPEGLVAMGGQLKSAFALGSGRRALLGPHLGDLDTEAGEHHFRSSLAAWLKRQGLAPRRIAVDQHPGYRSHRIGLELAAAAGAAPPLGVQHHHAHLLACLAEHGLAAPQVGVAWDGAGLGSDGSLWGGECLRLEGSGFTRLARLRPFPLPGAERALLEPCRAALGLLFTAFGAAGLALEDPADLLPPQAAFSAAERLVLCRMLERDVQAPLCSSVGRLFDAVASLLGLCQRCSFEAQAALRLEAAAWSALEEAVGRPEGADPLPACGRYVLALRPAPAGEPWQLDWQPLLSALLEDRARGLPVGPIALGFHRALAGSLVALAGWLGLERLLLGGGCFQNRLLLQLAVEGLRAAGIEPVWPQRIPCNDGGLALGQLLAASGWNPG